VLDEARRAAPRNAEAAFFRMAAALHAYAPGTLSQDRVNKLYNNLRGVMGQASDCGLPDLLAGMVARHYCEPYGLAWPLGASSALFERARAKGTTPEDLADLQSLVRMPPPAPVAPVPPPLPPAPKPAPKVEEPPRVAPVPQPPVPLVRLPPRPPGTGMGWVALVGLTCLCGGRRRRGWDGARPQERRRRQPRWERQ
jgi:hypothetical protein